ncbi:hypothetical protein ABMA28_004617 [Loxostege sticticalis]|uniref:Neuropeptide-like 4 n=1 Tax=Loxostege sticticalis TaxID=481309 RepID=A0ABD0SRV2_LOXSC
MYKLLSFLAFLALAFAAPAPEPGAAILSPAVAYRAPLTYAPTLEYAYGAVPGAHLAYSAQYAYPYSAYPAYPPIAYSKIY